MPLLVTLAAAAVALWAARAGRMPRWAVAAAAVVAGLLLVAALASAAPIPQLFGRADRYEGLVALPVVLVAVWLGARLLGPGADAARHRAVLIATTCAASALAVLALLEAAGLRPLPTDLGRPGSLAGNAGDQGLLGLLYLAVLGNLVVGSWIRTRRVEAWAAAGTAASLIALATSAARAAWLGALVVAIVLAVRLVRASVHRVRAAVVVVGAAAAVAALTLAVPAARSRLFGAAAALADKSASDRPVIWADAVRVVAASPWVGAGPSGFQDAATRVFPVEWYRGVSPSVVLDSPHEVLLQAAVAGGIPGLIAALAVIGAVVVAGIRRIRGVDAAGRKQPADGARRDLLFGALAGIGGGILTLLAQPTSPKTLLMLGLLAGWLIAVPRAARPTAAKPWRVAATAGFAAWAVLLGVWALGDAPLLQASYAAARGDAGAADAGFRAAQTLRPWDADIALSAAQALGAIPAEQNPDAARRARLWADDAAARLPASAAAWEAAGMARLAVAQDAAAAAPARRALDRAVALSPQNPRMWHEDALAAFAAGDLAAARRGLERATALAPGSFASWQALGAVCSQLGDAACTAKAASGARSAGG